MPDKKALIRADTGNNFLPTGKACPFFRQSKTPESARFCRWFFVSLPLTILAITSDWSRHCPYLARFGEQ
jgi:hypothetical protein